MKTVVTFSGKARQVFRYIALAAKANPTMTVKDMEAKR